MYKKKTEAAKKDYLKALAAYRASLVSKVINLQYCYQWTTKYCYLITRGGFVLLALCSVRHTLQFFNSYTNGNLSANFPGKIVFKIILIVKFYRVLFIDRRQGGCCDGWW